MKNLGIGVALLAISLGLGSCEKKDTLSKSSVASEQTFGKQSLNFSGSTDLNIRVEMAGRSEDGYQEVIYHHDKSFFNHLKYNENEIVVQEKVPAIAGMQVMEIRLLANEMKEGYEKEYIRELDGEKVICHVNLEKKHDLIKVGSKSYENVYEIRISSNSLIENVGFEMADRTYFWNADLGLIKVQGFFVPDVELQSAS